MSLPEFEILFIKLLLSLETLILIEDELIVKSPEIMSGTPVFKGTRVPIKNLTDYLEAGDSLDEFLDDFPSVSREQAIAVLHLAFQPLIDLDYENIA